MNNKKVINIYNFFILLIVLLVCYYLLYLISKETTIENFSIKDIGKISSSVKDINNSVNKLPAQINNKMESLGKKIEKNTIIVLQKKMKSIFTQLGEIFNKGLINPIFSLIIGIGSIFILIFEVLKIIVDKIVSLPNCIIIYIFGSIGSFINIIYKKIIPKFIRNIVSKIYSYTIKFIIDWIGKTTGYVKKSEKCYAFNVKDQISNMNNNFKKIDSNFKNNFGRLDFSSITF